MSSSAFDALCHGDTLIVNDGFKNAMCGKLMEMYSIPFDANTFQHLHHQNWDRCQEENIRLNPDSTHYLHFRVKNDSQHDKNFLLFLHNVQIDKARLWIYVSDSLMYASPQTGCTLPGHERPTQDRTISLPIFLKSNTIHDIYISVYRMEFGITVSPQLVEPITGVDFRWTDFTFLSVIGFNLLLLGISIFLWILCRVRKIELKELNWFMVYSAIGCLYIISASGYGSLFLWGSWPWFEVNSAIFFGALSNFGFLYFCKYALGIEKQYPKLGRFFDLVAILYLTSSMLGFGMYYGYYVKGIPAALLGLFYLGMLVCMLAVIYFAIKTVIVEKKRIFIWFLSIFVFYIAFVVVVFALELGYIRYNFKLHAYLLMFCFFPQMLFTLAYLIIHFIQLVEIKTTKYHALKNEIAGEIHDKIGKNLARISLSSYILFNDGKKDQDTMKSKLESIRNDAIHANDQLRELLTALQATTEKFDRLQSKFREMSIAAFDGTNINLEIKTPNLSYNPDVDKMIKSQLLMIFNDLIAKIKLLSNIENVMISFGLTGNDGYLLQFKLQKSQPINENSLQSIIARCQKINASLTIHQNMDESTTIAINGKLNLSWE